MRDTNTFLQLLVGSSFLFLGGCGVGSDNFTDTYSVKVSALHYIKDANVTIEGIRGKYRDRGIYDFNTSVGGVRLSRGGVYITNDTNESDTAPDSTRCSHYLPSLDTTVASLQLSAPAEHVPYAYININPFTSLLVHGNVSKESLALEYPIAASIEEHFDFDTTAALKAEAYNKEDQNLTKEICDALQALQQL